MTTQPNATPTPRSKIAQHAYWARTQGVRRLIEEDQLDPVERSRQALAKWWWRRSADRERGTARPVWIVGVQRSGTNMVVRGLQRAPEVESHNENDRKSFEQYRLRDEATIGRLIDRSLHELILFKPLCDSHRVDEMLKLRPDGRAVWIYREVDGRIRSSLAKFGAHNRAVLERIAAGQDAGMWQSERLSPASRDLIRRSVEAGLCPADAAALFWLVRNRLVLELGLAERDDVALVSYDAFVSDPEGKMRSLCAFLGIPYRPAYIEGIAPRAGPLGDPLPIDPGIRMLCDELTIDLDRHALDACRVR